jgi:hypothetical protein
MIEQRAVCLESAEVRPGQSRPNQAVRATSAFPTGSDQTADGSFVPILLQKSLNAGRLVFRWQAKKEIIAGRSAGRPAADGACEFLL